MNVVWDIFATIGIVWTVAMVALVLVFLLERISK